MKIHHLLFAMLLIPLMLPSPAFPIQGTTHDKKTRKTNQNNPSLFQRSPQNAATRGVQIVVKRLEPIIGIGELNREKIRHAQDLGFKNGTEDASLGKDEFPIYEVSLRDLRSFTADKEVNNLIVDTHQILFPIEVKGVVSSSVTVRSAIKQTDGMEQVEQGELWRPTRWGLPKLIERLTSAKKDRLNENGSELSSFRLVSIPALNRNFLGYADATGIKLVPLVPDKSLKPLQAKQALLDLVPEAKSVDGSPR
jgi:hypothetical protein